MQFGLIINQFRVHKSFVESIQSLPCQKWLFINASCTASWIPVSSSVRMCLKMLTASVLSNKPNRFLIRNTTFFTTFQVFHAIAGVHWTTFCSDDTQRLRKWEQYVDGNQNWTSSPFILTKSKKKNVRFTAPCLVPRFKKWTLRSLLHFIPFCFLSHLLYTTPD